jgi:hypothetical protein
MTPVKPQIKKNYADTACQVGFTVLQQFYSQAFVKSCITSAIALNTTAAEVLPQWLIRILCASTKILK